MGSESVLDDVFSAPEEDVETFMDLLAQNEVVVNKGAPAMESIARSAAEDRPDQIAYPQLVEQLSGLIRIQHGPHGDDYVWHIAPFVQSKRIINYKVSLERVVFAIARIMKDNLPEDIQAKIWLPYADWDIQEITFKALGAVSDWRCNKTMLDRINVQMFQTLNTLV